MSSKEESLEKRLLDIHNRIQWMADTEARAAWVNGYGAKGEFLKEKMELLDEADKLIERLEHYKGDEDTDR